MLELDPVIHTSAILAMALIFAVAAVHKLLSLAVFIEQLTNYKLLPEKWAPLVGTIIPWLELGAVILLINSSTRTTGIIMLGILIIIYTAAIGINLYRGRVDIDCGCLGDNGNQLNEQKLSGWMILRNIIIGMFIVCAALGTGQRSLSWLDSVNILFVTLSIIILYQIINQLIANNNLLIGLNN